MLETGSNILFFSLKQNKTKTPPPQMSSIYPALVSLGFLGFFPLVRLLCFPLGFFGVVGSLVLVWGGVFLVVGWGLFPSKFKTVIQHLVLLKIKQGSYATTQKEMRLFKFYLVIFKKHLNFCSPLQQ